MALIINGTLFNDTLTGFNPGDGANPDGVETINGLAGTDTLSGLGGNDTLNGDGDNDILNGGDGNDTINGGTDNDTVNGGAGADTLDGGIGSGDLLTYATSAAGITISILDGSVGVGGDAQGDVVTGFENLAGSAFDDTLLGSAGSNRSSAAPAPISWTAARAPTRWTIEARRSP